MKLHLDLIDTDTALSDLAKTLRDAPQLAVDTEFIRETSYYPIISLIQVATDREAWLIDAKRLDAKALEPFLELMTHPKILKVFHAIQADQECLFTAYGVLANPCLDTAIAAGLVGMGDQLGLGALLRLALHVGIEKGQARSHWDRRPLPETLKRYALADVAHLIALANALLGELDKLKRRDWAMKESAHFADPATYSDPPEAIALRLTRSGKLDRRAYAVLKNLVAWREGYCQTRNLTRRRVADDKLLVDLARVSPKDEKELAQFRGISSSVPKREHPVILSAIQSARVIPDADLPHLPKRSEESRGEPQIAAFLGSAVRHLADRHAIAPRYLATSDQLSHLSATSIKQRQDLTRYLSGEAEALIGDELWELLQGRIGIKLKNGKLTLAEV